MGQAQRIWAKKKRFELFFRLGGACRNCGSTRHLEFDCIEPKGDRHHRLSACDRVSFYYQQFRSGNLQLLCKYVCHKAKSLKEHQAWLAEQQQQDENCPF